MDEKVRNELVEAIGAVHSAVDVPRWILTACEWLLFGLDRGGEPWAAWSAVAGAVLDAQRVGDESPLADALLELTQAYGAALTRGDAVAHHLELVRRYLDAPDRGAQPPRTGV